MAALIDSTIKVGTSTGNTTDAIDTTGANLLIIAISYDSTGTPTVSDSKGNSYTLIRTEEEGAYHKLSMYYSLNGTVGASHTFTVSGANTFSSIAAQAYSQIVSLDQQNGATADGASLQTGSVTPTENNELLVTAVGGGYAGLVPASINSSFTKDDEQEFVTATSYGLAIAHLFQTTASAINPTWTPNSSVGMATIIATFKTVSQEISVAWFRA